MKTVDLFSGCGGMSLGFQNAGYEIKAAFDNWHPAVHVYSINFSHPIFDVDLSEENVAELISEFSPEIIIGGPPCQDFSIAGYNNKNQKRANLTIRFAELIAEVKPKWFVMENVYNIERNPILKKMLKIVKDAGYGITSQVLDASYVGVPQARKRYFLIGHVNSNDDFLKNALLQGLSDKQTTVHDYFKDSLGLEHYYMHPRSYKRRAVFSIHEPSSTIRGTNRPIPASYKCHPGDKADITEKVRPLTTKERSFIQTFPDSFKLEGSRAQLEQAIGNAVPVKLAEYVANCILRYSATQYCEQTKG